MISVISLHWKTISWENIKLEKKKAFHKYKCASLADVWNNGKYRKQISLLSSKAFILNDMIKEVKVKPS